MVLSWSRVLDDQALNVTADSFTRTLAVAAIARGFNGAISVAQGTEVAIQPIGVGVTLTLGEILDPINDLVERFSLLALLASVSLGLQLALGEMFATHAFSIFLTAACLLCALLIWRPSSDTWHRLALRGLVGIIVLRFVFVFVLLTTHWVDANFLQSKTERAVAQLNQTTTDIETLRQQQGTEERDLSFLERTSESFNELLDSSRQTLDIQAQLNALQAQIESSVREMINLIVIFILQTVLIPLAALWLLWSAVRLCWRVIQQ